MKIGVTQSSAARIRRAVEAVEAHAHQGIVTSERPQAVIEVAWVQITSTTQTDNRYPGSLYRRLGADATFELIGDAAGIWVDTPNGESLTTSTYYPARISVVKPSDGKPIFDVLAPMLTLTVEEADGSPSYTDITKIIFDQASRFKLTQPAANQVKVEIEGYTGTETIVTAVSCNAGTLSVTTKSFQWVDGILISVT